MKKITIFTLILAVLLLSGCTNQTNKINNTNKQVTNDNSVSEVVGQKKINTNTSTSDNLKNWKTYNNNAYAFSFKYPNDWSITEKQGVFPMDKSAYFYIIASDNSGQEFIVSPLSSYVLFQDGPWNKTQQDITVAGITATKNIYIPDLTVNWVKKPSSRAAIIFKQTPKNWNVDSNIAQITGTDNDYTILDQILTTFELKK